MFQLSVWKGPLEHLLHPEFLGGLETVRPSESHVEAAEWKSRESEFPRRLIQGNSGCVEIAGGQRTQCRGWTSFCQASPPKAERFRRRAADNKTARSNPQ